MRHLFIVNPVAHCVKGRLKAVTDAIDEFFRVNSQLKYDIHVTRWVRDATVYSRRYASEADSLVRIHVLGGTGALFEVINGVVGLPNVQIAAYPNGRNNDFLRYFGNDKMHLFNSMRSQVFSNATPIDTIRCGNTYALCYGLIGLEAIASRDGLEYVTHSRMPPDLCYIWAALAQTLPLPGRKYSQHYEIEIDGERHSGRYITMMIANTPCYGDSMRPASDAHPNDGRLDVYMLNDTSRSKFLGAIPAYISGNYAKAPDLIQHYGGRRIVVSSDSVMCICVDGETFYEHSVVYEIVPYSIDFVCPEGLAIRRLLNKA